MTESPPPRGYPHSLVRAGGAQVTPSSSEWVTHW